MAKGYQFGTSCHASLQDVAIASCGAANGLVSAGYMSCAGYSVGQSDIQLSIHIQGPNTQSYTQTIKPVACEYPTFNDTYLPFLTVAVPVLALIYVSKRVVSLFNNQDTAG